MKTIKDYSGELLAAFKKRKQSRLRKLNDRILRDAVLSFTASYYELAVISYVLSKIVSKPRFLRSEYGKGIAGIEKALESLSTVSPDAGPEELFPYFRRVQAAIARLESRDPRYLIDLFSKGRLKMAATLYAQGISLGLAAEKSGIDKQEIMDYAGDTMMFDRLKEEVDIEKRMKTAREFVGI